MRSLVPEQHGTRSRIRADVSVGSDAATCSRTARRIGFRRPTNGRRTKSRRGLECHPATGSPRAIHCGNIDRNNHIRARIDTDASTDTGIGIEIGTGTNACTRARTRLQKLANSAATTCRSRDPQGGSVPARSCKRIRSRPRQKRESSRGRAIECAFCGCSRPAT